MSKVWIVFFCFLFTLSALLHWKQADATLNIYQDLLELQEEVYSTSLQAEAEFNRQQEYNQHIYVLEDRLSNTEAIFFSCVPLHRRK